MLQLLSGACWARLSTRLRQRFRRKYTTQRMSAGSHEACRKLAKALDQIGWPSEFNVGQYDYRLPQSRAFEAAFVDLLRVQAV